ncbi:lysophospholipid acyltransferase family protein [Deinococcus pimensis]|uniref:lysophospholipid acyltransferase family protein n=1 Tax=Deinococcus pimensis TaxID=309888 RepID=UPI00048533B4|nr:lysophospholipid acyltransferase family protein [Deinococcus pimensis]
MSAPVKPPPSPAPSVNLPVYRIVQFVTGLPMWFGGGLTVEGREHVPMQGRLIVAGNHATALDPFVISHALPGSRHVQFMAKKELFDNRFIGWFIRTGGSFPVDREGNDVGAVRVALRILQNEGVLGIFPEGTRGGTELQGGVALLALKGKSPVLPAAVFRRGRRWVVRFGPPLAPQGGIREFTERIGEAIRALKETP